MADSAWLQAQGISRTSIHDYVRRGWLERVAPRVYRRGSDPVRAGTVRWDMAIISAQRTGSTAFHVGGQSAIELHGVGHFGRADGDRLIHLYGPADAVPSWLAGLQTDASLVVHTRNPLPADLGIEWRRMDLGTTRLGAAVRSPDAGEAWDHFLRVASPERAAIEMLDAVPKQLSFEHADAIFENLATLHPKLVTALLSECTSVRAKRLFLFFADRHDHPWTRHIDRSDIDLGAGKRQLWPGGRLDARYQITVPPGMASKAGETAQ